jgi:acyl transferase domain-containing protein
MKSVYQKNGLDPAQAGYVEAHGTGTKVGDPIEASALHQVFCKGRKSKPLFIGSVKSNIGHLEGASGVVSVIKSAMMLERGFILPNCDFKSGNSRIPFDEWNLKVYIYPPLPSVSFINEIRCLLLNVNGPVTRSMSA